MALVTPSIPSNPLARLPAAAAAARASVSTSRRSSAAKRRLPSVEASPPPASPTAAASAAPVEPAPSSPMPPSPPAKKKKMPPSPPPSQSGKRAKVTVARPEEPGTVGVKAAEPAAVDLLDSSLDNLRREEGGKRIGQQGPFLQKRGRSGRHGLFQPVGARRLGGRLISQSAEVGC
ncbi:hypothetical protein PVAP13_2NG177609 [Panicum virgatum]|uniref:Uncharacterized protein n=1 Tax=Panicum virgatum TaxID=38727 RepID=A0A8T0VCS9_PANVG|nr:hypothetical protein PVAP13_2NG177609 [Panicum virgatum]